MKKKQIIWLCSGLVVLAIIICIVLNLPKNQTDTNLTTDETEYEYIDTTNIEETEINWEDIINIDVSGFIGDVTVNISYNEIPDLTNKISKEEEQYSEKRNSQELSEEEQQEYNDWIDKLRNVVNEDYCSFPADINTKINGDTVKIVCNSETLKKLNYKFDDGFEITLSGLLTKKDNAEVEADLKSKAEYESQVASGEIDEEIETTVETEETQKNYYTVVGNDIIVTVKNLETANLNQTKSSDQRLIIVVDNDNDFEKVKEYALSNGNIDLIQNGETVYDKESNFTEGEQWKGISLEQ